MRPTPRSLNDPETVGCHNNTAANITKKTNFVSLLSVGDRDSSEQLWIDTSKLAPKLLCRIGGSSSRRRLSRKRLPTFLRLVFACNFVPWQVSSSDFRRSGFQMSSLSTAVVEQIPVGNPSILESQHVSEGPGRIAKAPVPSVYVDERGDIHRLRVGGQRLNILSTKQESMRSGYLHPHALYSVVLSGAVQVWTLTDGGTVKRTYKQYEHYTVPAYVPHVLYFQEDSIIAEWWDKNTDFACYYYHPYRKLIDVQNSVMQEKSLGHHRFLVPQDDAALGDGSKKSGSWGAVLGSVVVGICAGVGLGFVAATSLAKQQRR